MDPAPENEALRHGAADFDAVRSMLAPGAVHAAFQPIVRMRDDEVLGYEALARMTTTHGNGPAVWLAAAERHGVRGEFEVACLRAATASGLPPDGGLLVVNLSASLLGDRRVQAALEPLADRLVIELSEQEPVHDYVSLSAQIGSWQERGTRIAVDDAGSGYASLRHVLRVEPAFIKLDQSLVHGVDRDRIQRALIASIVAFARESGAEVIAEGVETQDQMAALLHVGVSLAQGYLLGRPAAGWRSASPVGRLDVGRCRTIAEVGDVVCAHLARRGVMPSLYLEREDLLRCVAQRGLWQVLDGLAPTQGVTGRAFREARLVVVDDISTSTDYLEAIPHVVAEACVPVFVDGRPVGALNMDSRRPFDEGDLLELQRCAALVGRWLAGGRTDERSGGVAQLASAVVRMERAAGVDDIDQLLLDAAIAISGMPSAMVVRRPAPDRLPAISARGPQRTSLLATDPGDLDSLVDIVLPSRSCYSAGSDDALGMVGTDALRRSGTRAIVVVPLRPQGGAPALLAVTSSRRRHLHTDTIELLELLAAQATARLETLAHMDELRRQAHEDPLTGIGNRGAFTVALEGWLRDGTSGTLAVLDVDGFKGVNEPPGDDAVAHHGPLPHVEVFEEPVQHGDALDESTFDVVPLVVGDDARNQIQREGALDPFALPVHRERDASGAEGLVAQPLASGQLTGRERTHLIHQRLVVRTRAPLPVVRLVEEVPAVVVGEDAHGAEGTGSPATRDDVRVNSPGVTSAELLAIPTSRMTRI